MAWRVVTTFAAGADPENIAITPDGAYAYIGSGSGFVYVVSTVTHATVATITTGTVRGVTITPDGTHVYVTVDYAVAVIATASNTVVATIPIGPFEFPTLLAVTPDGQQVWVLTSGPPVDAVYVIATATNMIVATFDIATSGYKNPTGIAVDPAGDYVYVAVENFSNEGQLIVFDTAGPVLGYVIALNLPALLPSTAAITPDGMTVYVGTAEGIQPISPPATVGPEIVTSAIPGAVTVDGKYLMTLGQSYGDGITVIATASGTVSQTVTFDGFVNYLALTPDGKFVWVTVTSSDIGPAVVILGQGVPPTRQFPRDDALALGTARQQIGPGQSSSLQGSIRQGWAGTYS